MTLTPTLGRWAFRLSTILAPAVIDVVLELQRQIDGAGDIDWRALSSAALGVIIVALLHLARSGTETAEAAAESVTGLDQDEDDLVETPEGL